MYSQAGHFELYSLEILRAQTAACASWGYPKTCVILSGLKGTLLSVPLSPKNNQAFFCLHSAFFFWFVFYAAFLIIFSVSLRLYKHALCAFAR